MIRTVTETGSTNADLAARLTGGEVVPEGTWLVADRQSAGRGRLSREWFDGAGNFMGSTVVHRRFGDPDAGSLALVAGLAVHAAAATCLPLENPASLKWPNDVLVGGAKLAGILMEAVGDSIVIGIGVNLAVAPTLPDRPAVAIGSFGPAPRRDDFAEVLARLFDMELERWRNFGLAPIIRRWCAAAHPQGTPLSVTEPDGSVISGAFDGLDDTGALMLRLADGTRRVIHAGDVVLAQSQQEN